MTYRSNTNLQNTSFSQYFKIDTAGPEVIIANISSYGNSTNTELSSSDYGVGTGINYYWNFDNTTVFQSFNSQDTVFPTGLDEQVCGLLFGVLISLAMLDKVRLPQFFRDSLPQLSI